MRKMKCPYCENIFKISNRQMANNHRFKCPACRKYNEGSDWADRTGVLIGISKEDFKWLS